MRMVCGSGRKRSIDGEFASPADVFIGKRLAAHRRRVGVSRKQMAFDLGVSYQTVQKYEQAINKLSAHKLSIAAKTLGTSVSYLVGETDYPRPPADTAWLSTTDAGLCAILEAVARLKPDQLAAVAGLIATMEEGPEFATEHAL